ncbi:MAG: VWA domain-containing protein [Ruminococcus flavefaciens]|nr:VWA domain-containing protein [Ruminococcus flavefaciens]
MDSDDDELSDGDEVNTYSTDPLEPDTDFDGLSDSDELVLGTDPNLPDTDGDGTLDGEEKFAQTYILDVENEECAVQQVIVSMEGTGNLQNTMSVDNIMDKDFICSGVVGLVGVPFSIKTTSEFDTATLSFKIDQSKLGDTDFNDLLFLWYDEDNYQFVELETTYDEDNSLVSVQTTHFSRYMVVDKYRWFEAWNKDLNYTSISYEKSICYSVLAVDCSGSMETYDPITIIQPNSAPYKPVYSCERQKAVSSFTNALDNDDKVAIVTFESSASTVCELTDNKTDLYWASASFYNGGGTSFDAALRKSIDILKSSTGGTRKKIILLSDGYSSVSDSILNEAKSEYIKVYTVGIGNCSDSVLSKIATETGGEYFKAYNASELLSIYSQIGITDDFDTTDTDGDGLYDVVETAGIRIQNGMILRNNPETDTFFSNPSLPDTDNDGLSDGEEIDPQIRCKHQFWGAPELSTGSGYYFFMKSDPSCQDSDGDGIVDNYCESTKNTASYGFSDPNPLTSDVTKTALKHDFFSIDYEYKDGVEKDWKDNNSGSNESYGGYQGWFGRYGYTKDMKIFCNQSVTGLEIHNNGCGIIALGDMLLYMAIGDPTYNPTMDWSIPTMMDLGSSYNHIDFDTYVWYIYTISNYFSYLPFIKGLAGDGLLFSNLENGLKLMSLNNSMNLKKIEWQYSSNSAKTLSKMKEMLSNDIPVVYSISASFEKNKLPLYMFDENNMLYIAERPKSHFMDATAIIEFSPEAADLLGHKILIKTATYGKEYYADYDEFADRLSWDTNILYVEK